MREFMMIMMRGPSTSSSDWASYINGLRKTSHFRGGSSLANGVIASKHGDSGECSVSGFMRFEAENIDDVRRLLGGHPLYEAGGTIEILELVKD